MKFFDRFPTIDYPKFGLVKDLTIGVNVNIEGDLLPYQVPEGTRPDIVADKYYGHSQYEWLMYAVNDVVNPRDLIPLTSDQFDKMIVRKYQSIDNAQNKTQFWRHNYRDDLGSILTENDYLALPLAAQGLFDVQKNFDGSISGYVRKKVDLTRNTNMIYRVVVEQAIDWVVGDVLKFSDGFAEVFAIDGQTTFVGHVRGAIQGTIDRPATTITPVSSTVESINISAAEVPYFERVSVYQYLYELNEARQNVKMVDKRLVPQIEQQLEDLL